MDVGGDHDITVIIWLSSLKRQVFLMATGRVVIIRMPRKTYIFVMPTRLSCWQGENSHIRNSCQVVPAEKICVTRHLSPQTTGDG